jgi:putative transposase
VPDIALHIVQRGHNRRDCFREETDYLVYLSNLRCLLSRTGCALHAYCLMTNHVHLLLTPSSPQACALLMRNQGQRYVQYFNRRYGRRGTLWEGRYKSSLIHSASYLMRTYRYIERNPVRAEMVASPCEYPWSSHAGNCGRVESKLLTPSPEYLALGTDEQSRFAAYEDFVAIPMNRLSLRRSGTRPTAASRSWMNLSSRDWHRNINNGWRAGAPALLRKRPRRRQTTSSPS